MTNTTPTGKEYDWLDTIFDDIKLDYRADMLTTDFDKLADAHKAEILVHIQATVEEAENTAEKITYDIAYKSGINDATMADPAVPDELRQQLLAISHGVEIPPATVANENVTLYIKLEPLLALFTQYARQERLDELKRVMQIPFITQHVYYGERVAQLTATPHGGEDK